MRLAVAVILIGLSWNSDPAAEAAAASLDRSASQVRAAEEDPTCSDSRVSPTVLLEAAPRHFTPIWAYTGSTAYATDMFRGEIIYEYAGTDPMLSATASDSDFHFVRALRVGEGDSLHVFDPGSQYHHVLTPDLRIARSAELPVRLSENGAILLPGGQYVASGRADPENRPLHLVNAAGEILVSFGPPRPAGALPYVLGHALRPGLFWTAAPAGPLYELWDAFGERKRRISRKVSWWVHGDWASAGTGSAIVGIGEREDGLVILARTPLEDSGGRQGTSPPSWAPEYRVLYQVLDPTDGRVIGTCDFGTGLAALIKPDLVVSFSEGGGGVGIHRIWHVPLFDRSL